MTKVEIIDQQEVVPMATKKVWNVLRVLYFMLRKEISRRKLMSDLSLLMKRGKLAGKAFTSLMTFYGGSNHHHHPRDLNPGHPGDAEYEFSCSNSPAAGGIHNINSRGFFSSLHLAGKRQDGNGHFHRLFGCAHPPRTDEEDDDDVVVDMASFGFDEAAIMETEAGDQVSEMALPMLPGFGMVRQLRITDSPYPLKDEGDGGKVDKAAEEFIQKFYKALQKQKSG